MITRIDDPRCGGNFNKPTNSRVSRPGGCVKPQKDYCEKALIKTNVKVRRYFLNKWLVDAK
ncbi:hypothetical protein HanRHA438_Chr00c58g0859611 [Helianthus annuus]|nr:hypothetical protein HanRHA438_Chr00c58g0859611 [Helianthus annuus]